MPKIKTIRMKLPSHWASALVNGDFSGLSDVEEKEINDFLTENPHLGPCFDCGDVSELARYEGLLCDVLTYTFPVRLWREEPNGLKYLIYPAVFVEKPLPHHKLGLSYTATGYGAKIPTEKMALILGRFYRVYSAIFLYSAIFPNIGTNYVIIDGQHISIN